MQNEQVRHSDSHRKGARAPVDREKLIPRLNRDAAYRVLRGKEKCILTNGEKLLLKPLVFTCQCGECLLARSIYRGLKFPTADEDSLYLQFKRFLSASSLFLVFAPHPLNRVVTILLFSVTLSWPFTYTPDLINPMQTYWPSSSTFSISRETIINASRRPIPPVLSLPPRLFVQ
jgi:hypothetical protein